MLVANKFHTCSLRSVLAHVHAAVENLLKYIRRYGGELCEAFFDSLRRACALLFFAGIYAKIFIACSTQICYNAEKTKKGRCPMKRFFAMALALALMLSLAACGGNTAPETTVPPTTAAPETTPPTTVPPTTVPETVPPTTVEETEPPVLFRNPLNGEPLDELYTARPYTVTINNIKQALPQCGVENADIIFETLVEGDVTRCLAVFGDVAGIEHLGAVRSARTYFVDLTLSLDAIFVHHGGSDYAYDLISETGADDLDAMKSSGSAAFYRDQDRLNSGVSLEHTSFATGDKLVTCAEKRHELTREEGIDYGWIFAEEATPENGADATAVTACFTSNGKKTSFTYNAETGLYEAAQYGKAYIDGNTGNTMAFENLIMITAKSWLGSDNYHRFNELTYTEGTGMFACNGKLIPIKWSREGYSDPLEFYLEDGTPLTLSVGKSYIAVLSNKAVVDYE